MFVKKTVSLSSILDESPFFTELSFKEREKLISELLQTYPELCEQNTPDMEVGYEASWFAKQGH